jgi:transposase
LAKKLKEKEPGRKKGVKTMQAKKVKKTCNSPCVCYNNINGKNAKTEEKSRGNEMKIFKEYNQKQTFLLPSAVDDFVESKHPARIISDVIDTININGIRSEYKGGGSTAYHPGMILKVLIYAYSQAVYSSRKIERAVHTDTAFMYLAGMQKPDFRTICLFRSKHAKAIKQIFIEVVRLCASLGMVGLGHIAFDGTKLKANASVRQTREEESLKKEMQKVTEEIDGLLTRAKEVDECEDLLYGKDNDGSGIPDEIKDKEYRLKKLKQAKKQLAEEELNKVNITDPDARLMQNSKKVIHPGYNGQVAVDAKEQIIVASDLTQDATDHYQLEPMLEQVEQNLGVLPEQISADAGYSSYDNLEHVEEKATDAYIPDNKIESLDEKKESETRYDKSNFIYDEENDQYTCPEGKVLTPYTKTKRKEREITVYRGTDCNSCPVKSKCTKAQARTIARDGREPLQEKMREKLRSQEGKEIYKKRAYTVEPVFGNMKWNRPKLIMSMRGKKKVTGEFILMCLTHNIGKIIRKVQVKTAENSTCHHPLMAMAG